ELAFVSRWCGNGLPAATVPSSPLIEFAKRGRLPSSVRFSRGKHFYGKKNFPVIRSIDRRDPVRLDERIFGYGARNYTDAAGCYHQLRTSGREGRAERRDCVYYRDRVANAGPVSVFRLRATTIFRRTTTAATGKA